MPAVILYILIFFLFFSRVSAQDTINRLNGSGKKQGLWLSYMNAKGFKTDSASAVFKVFEYFDNGKNVWDFNRYRWKKRLVSSFTEVIPPVGQPELITGKITWVDKIYNLPSVEEAYLNGMPIKFRDYVYRLQDAEVICITSGTIDFMKRFNGQPGTFHVSYEYRTKNSLNADVSNWWYYKGKRKWKTLKTNE
jgi:hypothetical protein